MGGQFTHPRAASLEDSGSLSTKVTAMLLLHLNSHFPLFSPQRPFPQQIFLITSLSFIKFNCRTSTSISISSSAVASSTDVSTHHLLRVWAFCRAVTARVAVKEAVKVATRVAARVAVTVAARVAARVAVKVPARGRPPQPRSPPAWQRPRRVWKQPSRSLPTAGQVHGPILECKLPSEFIQCIPEMLTTTPVSSLFEGIFTPFVSVLQSRSPSQPGLPRCTLAQHGRPRAAAAQNRSLLPTAPAAPARAPPAATGPGPRRGGKVRPPRPARQTPHPAGAAGRPSRRGSRW